MIPYVLVVILHVLVALFLIVVILLQGGRGGLGEALGGAAAQSLFGGAVNTVMTKITGVCAGLFMVTSLSLAMLSTARGRSVMEQFRQITPAANPLQALPGPQATPQSPVAPHAPTTPQASVAPEPPPSTPAPGEPAGAPEPAQTAAPEPATAPATQ